MKIASDLKLTSEQLFQLGKKCSQDTSQPKNLEQAVEYYQLAANQDHAAAQYNLGCCYQDGIGVPCDEVGSIADDAFGRYVLIV